LPEQTEPAWEHSVQVLITGVAGFVGTHLSRHILDTTPEAQIHGAVMTAPSDRIAPVITQHVLDLCDLDATRALLEAVQPDQIYHLAAQASVSRSFEAPWETLQNNILAQLNIIQACLRLPKPPRLVIICSGEIYGAADPDELPSREESPLRPGSPYSVSKVTQDMLGLQYYLSHNLPIMRARPFNHLGPGQSEGFVGPDFAVQIARIEAGEREPVMYVGNLTVERDFTDVRDVVRAYRLIMENGTPGEVYNVASGKTHSIRALLDGLLRYTTMDIEVCVDPARMRPARIPILWGDATRLRDATDWQPTIPFEQTLLDVLNDCRQRVQQAH
jgi:GDP-4-dehydro-6-deoxy-D-mannose reductase